MKSIKSYAFLFLPLLLAGCGMSEQEAALSEMVDCWNEMTDVLETIQDENTAVLAQPKLEKLGKKMEAASNRLASSMAKDPQKMMSLAKDYEKPLAEAGQRFGTELMRVACISGVGEDVQELFASMNFNSSTSGST